VVEVDVLVPCSPLMVMHDDADTGVDRPEGPTALCAATMSGSRRGLQDLCMEFDSI
jgi:hypothetical protein